MHPISRVALEFFPPAELDCYVTLLLTVPLALHFDVRQFYPFQPNLRTGFKKEKKKQPTTYWKNLKPLTIPPLLENNILRSSSAIEGLKSIILFVFSVKYTSDW